MAESLNATFFAFRKREKGGVLLGASIVFAVLGLLAVAAFAYLNWQAIADYMNWTMTMGKGAENADPNDPSALFASMMPPASVMQLGGVYFLFLVVYYLLLAAYEAACLRWMIRGETKGLFGLALDADTLRVYFTYWVWFFLLIAFYLVIAVVIVGLGAGLALGAQGNPDAAGPMMVLLPILMVVAVLVGLIYFGVRFAPAAATSIAKRRFAFFDAWTVTKGRFWALFGAFALLFLMYFVGVIILSSVATFAMVGGLAEHARSAPEPQSIEAMFALFASPNVWAPMAVCYGLIIVGMFMFYVALFGVNARAAHVALQEGKIQAAG